MVMMLAMKAAMKAAKKAAGKTKKDGELVEEQPEAAAPRSKVTKGMKNALRVTKAKEIVASGKAALGKFAKNLKKASASGEKTKEVAAAKKKKAAVGASKAKAKKVKDQEEDEDDEDDEDEDEDDAAAEPPLKKAPKKTPVDPVVQRKKELNAMAKTELQKEMKKLGLNDEEQLGKLELVGVILAHEAEAQVLTARKKELSAMAKADLKKVVESKGIDAALKTEMVEALLSHEAKERSDARAHEAKVQELAEQHKEELKAKGAADLKEICEKKGLKLGGSKEEKVQRLLDAWKVEGTAEKTLAAKAREERKHSLLTMEKELLFKLCDKSGIDPLVKEVMVERILLREDVAGPLKEKAAKEEEQEGPKEDSKTGAKCGRGAKKQRRNTIVKLKVVKGGKVVKAMKTAAEKTAMKAMKANKGKK